MIPRPVSYYLPLLPVGVRRRRCRVVTMRVAICGGNASSTRRTIGPNTEPVAGYNLQKVKQGRRCRRVSGAKRI